MLSDYIQLTLSQSVKAAVSNTSNLKVRTQPGKNIYLKVKKKKISLAEGKKVKILKETTANGQKWFYVSFSYRYQNTTRTYKGYVPGNNLSFVAAKASNAPAITQTPKPSPKVSQTPTLKPSPKISQKPTSTPARTSTDSEIGKTGIVAASALNVRTGAGTSYEVLNWKSGKVQITYGTSVRILEKILVDTSVWFKVSFNYQGTNLYGYVSGKYIQIGGTIKPSPSAEPMPEPVYSSEPKVSHTPLSNAQFEAELKKEGFPNDYKDGLRTLHQRYPLWQFKAIQTGINWSTAIENENKVGKNLITKSKASGWKSYASGAYNWSTDSFIPYDGSTWVTASKQAIEYYMDPRNFLTTDGIFQFEYLGYEPDYQTKEGVESILKNTVLYNKTYTYLSEKDKKITKTYGETFINAADYSKVSPFHLATRVKQEVVKSDGLSSSASGKLDGYVGYYNFYNIGAYHSTKANGAIINGLTFAKTGSNMSEANKEACLIPWNNQYKTILGGAKYIGNQYINRGQNTIYLQKFNISSYNTFMHQYMANVEAAKSEAQRTYMAYKDFSDIPVVFYIPVYNNMPSVKAPVPENVKNPNNWLKSLSITDLSDDSACVMTPTFNISNSKSITYTVMVDSGTASVKINATGVSSFASISGTGIKKLNEGTNTFKIKVTAQNGDVRTYIVYVIKS